MSIEEFLELADKTFTEKGKQMIKTTADIAKQQLEDLLEIKTRLESEG